MRATLDWTYSLLTESRRLVLRRLAIFAGNFSLEAAAAVVAERGSDAAEFLDCMANLVAMSLVETKIVGPNPSYRLFETTRAYALEKLRDSGELEQVALRHAEFFQSSVTALEQKASTSNRQSSSPLRAFGRSNHNRSVLHGRDRERAAQRV
jgi:predicted ATPase